VKPILHIGYPKTGSTWFQRRYYPNILNAVYLERSIVQELFIAPGAFEFDEKKAKSFFEKYTGDRLIICEELLLGRLKPGGVKGHLTKEVGRRLKAVFPEATIILFLRNQMDALASSYLQYIKAGGNYGIKRYLLLGKESNSAYKKLVLLGPEYFLYHKILDFYSDLFGKENVHIYLYEDFEKNINEFIYLFGETYDLNVNIDQLDFQRVNSGYRRYLIPLKKIINSFTRQGSLFKYYIFHVPYVNNYSRYIFDKLNHYKIFGQRPSTHEILGKKNAEYLKEFYKKSNQILIDQYGLSNIKKYNYPL
jgi:hypothetical protein